MIYVCAVESLPLVMEFSRSAKYSVSDHTQSMPSQAAEQADGKGGIVMVCRRRFTWRWASAVNVLFTWPQRKRCDRLVPQRTMSYALYLIDIQVAGVCQELLKLLGSRSSSANSAQDQQGLHGRRKAFVRLRLLSGLWRAVAAFGNLIEALFLPGRPCRLTSPMASLVAPPQTPWLSAAWPPYHPPQGYQGGSGLERTSRFGRCQSLWPPSRRLARSSWCSDRGTGP